MHPRPRLRTVWYLTLVVGMVVLSACVQAFSSAQSPTITAPIRANPTISPVDTPAPTRRATPAPATPNPPATPTLNALDRDTRERIFIAVWTAVADHYVYRDFRGVNWDAVYDTFLPQALAAATPQDFYDVMRTMIDELGDDHTRFDDPQAAAMNDAVYNGTAEYAGIGIMVRELTRGIMITRIARDGPAAQAGLQPYDVITAVDQTAITPTFMREDGNYGALIRGPVGSTVEIEYIRGNTPPQRITVTRAMIPGDAFPEAIAQRLDDNIILLTIDSFDRDHLDTIVSAALSTAMNDEPVAGLIIDLRENGGGSIEDMLAVVALFHDGGSIGTQVDRNNIYQLRVPNNRVLTPFDQVPIVLVTSGDTASAAEMFSAGMRALRDVTIIGETTAGNSENLFPYDLEDGSVLWLAELLYKRPDGTYIEDVGVIPDVELVYAWDTIDTRQDPFIAHAVETLNTTHPVP